MSPLFQGVLCAVEASGWKFERVPDQEVLEAQFEAHHTRVPVHLQAFPDVGVVHAVATSPHAFTHHHVFKLSELLMRATNQLAVGNWELEWEQRRVLFRVSQLFAPEGDVPSTIVAAMIHTAVAEMDRLTPALAELAGLDAAGAAFLDVRALLAREDWLPPVPAQESA